jgi:uncharacterized protein with von Willebrand factor type A (vWA) domain
MTGPAGPAARVSGFMAHLRANGFAVGPGEAEMVLRTLDETDLLDATAARLGLKCMLSGERAEWERFDELFDAFWLGRGVKTVQRSDGRATASREHRRPEIWSTHLPPPDEGSARAAALGRAFANGDEADVPKGEGRLAASGSEMLATTDLRAFSRPEEIAEAEEAALRVARAMRYRLSRRRVPARRARVVDLRRTIRRNLSRGGEPIELLHKRRPERPVRLVLVLDVSGSMKLYSRFFLAFVRGLLGHSIRAEAFLFHTRLVRITDVLRDENTGRAPERLSLIAEGFGGGTRIASAFKAFNERYAREVLGSRSVVIVMSDGYDTDPPEALDAELARLKRRARRLVWLNPLICWRDYAPVARAMAAALPHIDCFAAAHSLASLAALEGELARL